MALYWQVPNGTRGGDPVHRLIWLLILLAPAPAFPADPIYKSVDPQGNVTYSATPPPEGVSSERLVAPAPPTEEDVQRAEAQTRKLKEQAAELERERKAREAEQAAAAEDAVPPPGRTVVIPVPGSVGDPGLVPVPGRPVPAPLPAGPPVRR